MALKKLASLWKGKPGSKALLTGKTDAQLGAWSNMKVVMFKNDKGGNEKRPDYRLMYDDGDDSSGRGEDL